MKYSKLAKAAIMSMAVFSQSSFAAVYQVAEIDTQNISRNAFAVDINASGDVILSVNYSTALPVPEHNIPIDLTLIDFDSDAIADLMTDLESARNGDFNLADYQTILSLISATQGTDTTQRLVPWLSYVSDNGVLEFIPGLDMEDPDYGGYTKSVDTRVQGINDNGVIVGNTLAVPRKVEYTTDAGNDITYILREHGNRGFVDLNGVVVGLVSESDLAGGITQAFDVNNNLVVAGTEIFDPSEGITQAVANCSDDELRGDQPVELCLSRQQLNLGATHQRRAVLWNLDNDGNVVSKNTFGLPFTPEEDDTRIYASEATAVNDNGVAVGRASNFFEDNTSLPRLYAAIFSNNEVTSITDRNEYISSQATDINNNNMAVGFASRIINGFERSKFFVYNIDTNEINFPDDFFSSSTSIARGINDNGLVVGEGEVETNLSTNRRSAAFLYDINDNTFQNINDLLSCDSEYNIVQAHDINNSGQIAAVALVRRAERDVQGNVILADDGSENLIDVLITVVLNPVPGGQIDSCEVPPEQTQQRSGSFGFWGMLLLAVVFIRRFRL